MATFDELVINWEAYCEEHGLECISMDELWIKLRDERDELNKRLQEIELLIEDWDGMEREEQQKRNG